MPLKVRHAVPFVAVVCLAIPAVAQETRTLKPGASQPAAKLEDLARLQGQWEGDGITGPAEIVKFPLVAVEKDAWYFDGLTIRREGPDGMIGGVRIANKDGTSREALFRYRRVK